MEYDEASGCVRSLLDPYNGGTASIMTDYERDALEKVLEWADRYEDLRDG